MSEHVFVSRLRWDDRQSEVFGAATILEVPHVRGVPVDSQVPQGAVRIREWPNRLGILEHGSDADTVRWRPWLAPAPPNGTVSPGYPTTTSPIRQTPADLDTRTRWFRRLLRHMSQLPDVTPVVEPEAPCGILLTPGWVSSPMTSIPSEDTGLARPVDRRLPEFPGGLQLELDDHWWRRREEYAAQVERILREGS